MRLTLHTDYSLRVLIFLSIQAKDERVTISEIAEHFSIPRNHLVKVIHRLSQLHYINTTRGKHGGILLGRPANEIVIGDVVRKMEANLDIIDCSSPSPCPIRPDCRLKGIINDAAQAFLNVLDQYTIADLQQDPEGLRVLLNWKLLQSG